MPGSLWWLPSLIVFGGTAALVVVIVAVFRARRRRLGPSGADAAAPLDIQAGVALVRADDTVRAAADEVEFARAEFGENATREFAAALASAREKLNEAFVLRQRLFDEIADTPAETTRWNTTILTLTEAATVALDTHTTGFTARRAEERTAPQRIAELTAAVADAERATDATRGQLAELQSLYVSRATADVATAPERAAAALSRARSALTEASSLVEQQRPAASALAVATGALVDANHEITAVETRATELDNARAEVTALSADLRLAVAEARVFRDAPASDPAAAAAVLSSAASTSATSGRAGDRSEVQSAIDLAASTLGSITGRGATASLSQRTDPASEIRTLQRASDAIDAATASARTAQQRIEGARSALRGAIFGATSQIDVAANLIERHRGRVGPDARTRLTEARRQLALAEAAADPVEALDTARRATRLAQDAEGLALYDAGPR